MYSQVFANKFNLTGIPLDPLLIPLRNVNDNTPVNTPTFANNNESPQELEARRNKTWSMVESFVNKPHLRLVAEQGGLKDINTLILDSRKDNCNRMKNCTTDKGSPLIYLRMGPIISGVIQKRDINGKRQETLEASVKSDQTNPVNADKVPPRKLGAPGGPEIDNKHTILREIDRSLGVTKPPDVEFIFVEPYASVSFFGKFGIGQNPYGHAAIRYTLPDGTQKVMNIVGFKTENSEMVNFVQPDEYFFGTGQFNEGCEQMGVYNRNFVSVRIENYPPDKIMDMDYYFGKLKRRSKEKQVDYSLFMGPVWNFLREWIPLPVSFAERGNCAFWTSKGLVEADLMSWPRPWPKSIWVELYEHWGKKDRNNVHVVSYRRAQEAELSYGKPGYTPSIVGPLYSFQNLAYRNLENFADVIVEVPPHSTHAVVRKQEKKLEPSFFRHHRFSTATLSFITAYVAFRAILRLKRK